MPAEFTRCGSEETPCMNMRELTGFNQNSRMARLNACLVAPKQDPGQDDTRFYENPMGIAASQWESTSSDPAPDMNSNIVIETARKTLGGEMSFPEVVSRLAAAGVDYYHVDYVGKKKVFYGTDDSMVVTHIDYQGLPRVAADFSVQTIKAVILDSQRNGQAYRDFTRRAMAAGVQGYFAFLRGKRVTYFGRQGDQHTEWFPGAAVP
jgi:uncharacterized protein YbcV (DUF1398 family)